MHIQTDLFNYYLVTCQTYFYLWFPDFDSDDEESLRCLDCDVLFVNKRYLYRHLIFHVQQPVVKLDKVQVPNPPLKITLKVSKNNLLESLVLVMAFPPNLSHLTECQFFFFSPVVHNRIVTDTASRLFPPWRRQPPRNRALAAWTRYRERTIT